MAKLSRLPFNHDDETLLQAIGLGSEQNLKEDVLDKAYSLSDAHLLRLTSLLITHKLREKPFLYHLLLTAITKGYTNYTVRQIENLKLSQVIELIETTLLDSLVSLSERFDVEIRDLLTLLFFETVNSIEKTMLDDFQKVEHEIPSSMLN